MNAAERPWLVILNPASRGGAAARRFPALARALNARGIAFELATTRAAGEATTLATDAGSRGPCRVLAVGGDGTLNEVLNGLMATPARHLLAVAPMGTGNDWARGRAVPRDPGRIAAMLAAPRRLAHDVGVLEYQGRTGRETRHFINVAGAGYDAYVLERLPMRGPRALTYLVALAAGLARYSAPHFTVEAAEGGVAARLFVAFIALGPYCGGGLHFAPGARPDDGRFDVVTVEHLGVLAALARLPRIYAGRVLTDPAVRAIQTAHVSIATDVPARVEADGQLLGHTPLVARVLPGAIDMVVP